MVLIHAPIIFLEAVEVFGHQVTMVLVLDLMLTCLMAHSLVSLRVAALLSKDTPVDISTPTISIHLLMM